MEYEEWREQIAMKIAKKGYIKKEDNHWTVPLQSGKGSYVVSYPMSELICTCPDFENSKTTCKHIIADSVK